MEIIRPGINYDFLGKRRLFGAISIGLMAVSLLLIIFVGPNYGIDFRGGTNIIVRFNEEVDPAAVTGSMGEMGFDDAIVQRFGPTDEHMFLIQSNRISSIRPEDAERIRQVLEQTFGAEGLSYEYNQETGDRIEIRLPADAFENLPAGWDGAEGTGDGTGAAADEPPASAQQVSPKRAYLERLLTDAGLSNPRVSQVGSARQNRFLIRLQLIQDEVQQGLLASFGADFGGVERVETVGPRVGEQLRDDGVKAILVALFFILIYVALRFNVRFAPGAVACLFHDVLITFGILVALQEEITLTTLAALMTILGYSLNDTIVIYDRIRENMGAMRAKDIVTLVNRSVNETLGRTLLTNITVMLAVLAIYFVGGGLLQDFALPMVVGVVIGTYSTVYVANPIMIWLTTKMEHRSARIREAQDQARRAGSAKRSVAPSHDARP